MAAFLIIICMYGVQYRAGQMLESLHKHIIGVLHRFTYIITAIAASLTLV